MRKETLSAFLIHNLVFWMYDKYTLDELPNMLK